MPANQILGISHGGKDDCKRHVEGPVHEAKYKTYKSQLTLSGMFGKGSGAIDPVAEKRKHDVTSAELNTMRFFVEHNIAFSSADHCSNLFHTNFPDSKIATEYKAARTKMTSMVKYQAEQISSKIAEKSKPVFCLSTDGSNDNNDKFYPLVISYIDEGKHCVSLLSVPTVTEASCTGENIFQVLDTELAKFDLSWENCIAFGSDNAPVMVGGKKGVYGFIKERAASVYSAGCPCHLLHIAAKNGAKTLALQVEDVLTDAYYYLKHSAKRQTEFKEIQELSSGENLKVLKHVPTRWLSLKHCTDRLLHLRTPLRDYFRKERKDSGSCRPERVFKFLNSHTSVCLCMFLCYALEGFDKTNLSLQAEKPMIHKLQRVLIDFYRSLLVKFLKPSAFTGKHVLGVDIKLSYNQRTDKDLMIGEKTRTFMEEKKMSETKMQDICKRAREFYKTAAKYVAEKLPLQDQTLQHAEVFDPEKIQQKSFSSVSYFTTRFAALKPYCTMDELEEQFSNIQVEDLSSVLQLDRADEQWAMIGKITDVTGNLRYPDLTKLAQSVLLIPHSNASCERVFSNVRKVRTDFRGSMSASTLEAICTVKMDMQNSQTSCYEGTYTREETKAAKKATMKFNAKK